MADELQRHRIQVACPECGNLQTEPALVISTQCRACRFNFQVEDGNGVRRTLPVTRLAKPSSGAEPEPLAEPTKPKRPIRFGPSAPPPRPLWLRLFQPAKPPREVVCFGCHHAYNAIAEAQSSQCPKCGCYLSLIDHEIIDSSNARIETGGNVVIAKTGSLRSSAVRCHHLTVLGGLAASVESSGNIMIRSSGRITGTLTCRELRIEKGSRVEFLQPINAHTAKIDGQVRGQILCTGPVTLQKRAQLHGLLRCTELILLPGAKHTGTLELIEPNPNLKF